MEISNIASKPGAFECAVCGTMLRSDISYHKCLELIRPEWDDYFLDIAETVAKRSTCTRLHVGCVITQGNRIIATGYNGAAAGKDHCYYRGCLMEQGHCVRTTHAEMNALMYLGNYTKFLSAYVTHKPCEGCTAWLLANNIKKVHFRHEYPV
jgi:dCMP deaminase